VILAKVDFDEQALIAHIKDIVDTTVKHVDATAEPIQEIVIANVVDNKNWNPEAVYSPHDPNAGKPYDLKLSGQLLDTIKEKSAPNRSKDGFSIGIGNISKLEALRSKSGSHPSEKSANAPYWRFVVFGHGPPRQTWVFQTLGYKNGKRFGKIVRSDTGGRMRGTPPTYMFSNGLKASIDRINFIINDAMLDGVKEVEGRWR